MPGSLANLRQYKSSITPLIVSQFGGTPRIWQRNYYEHVIRDKKDWDRIRRYIETNIAHWADDQENPHVSML